MEGWGQVRKLPLVAGIVLLVVAVDGAARLWSPYGSPARVQVFFLVVGGIAYALIRYSVRRPK